MFPLKDDNPTEMVPYVTLAIIVACVVVWVQVQGAGMSESAFVGSICDLGAIPAEVTGAVTPGQRLPLGQGVSCVAGGYTWAALFTSLFLHGGWLHLIGNMWFLWIFGNNVEDSMGHTRFVIFYLFTGLLATAAHVVSAPDSAIPTVGASGAISGIMGAYMVLYPKAKVDTFIFLLIFVKIIKVPAALFLGLWFVMQLGSSFAPTGAGGGVAFWAHIGGFVAGAVLIKLFENRQLVTAKKAGVVLPRATIRHSGWM